MPSADHLGLSNQRATSPRGFSVAGVARLGLGARDDKEWRRRECPQCKSKPYQRCYRWQGTGEGKYLVDMPVPHVARTKETESASETD